MKKSYKQTIATIIFLILCYPLGLFVMWKYSEWDKEIKKFITIPITMLLLVIGYMHVSSYIENNNTKTVTPSSTITESYNSNKNSNTTYNYNSSSYSSSLTSTISESTKTKLLVVAKKEVKDRLKSPSSAKFALGTSNYTFATCSSQTPGAQGYLVKGYVNAKNSFGVELKTAFIIQLEMKPDDSYRVVQVMLDE